MPRPLPALLFIAACILLGVAWLNADRLRQLAEPQGAIAHSLDCPQLQAGCTFELAGRAFHLKTAEQPQPGQPFELRLRGTARTVSASWRMEGMDMGPNRYRLLASDGQQWSARTALPLCTAARDDWQLWLSIDERLVVVRTTIAHGKN
ncbi:hypothetical protein [Chitinilyticum litopenaei]|uniref:hypothetical protein n=1 Tax=Chitinilyticum litopenaei TaxID=1121276 RepID=UPI000429B2BF|nr:hypothetical protein [Chitinilyticum litopenaei]